MSSLKYPIFVCDLDQLREGEYRRVEALFNGQLGSVVVLRFQNQVYAYNNQCVHMPRPLDCEEKNKIFDAKNGVLRCSMHSIVYSPVTGESLSDICRGQKLTAVRTLLENGGIYLKDKRIAAL